MRVTDKVAYIFLFFTMTFWAGNSIVARMFADDLPPLQHAFWRWWAVAQGAMGPDGVVMTAPALDQDLSLAQGVKDLPVEQLITEAGVEALAVAVFPG